MPWRADRVLDLGLETAGGNLALDDAILEEAETFPGGAILRLWESASFAVVLGASRKVAGDVDLKACEAEGVPIVRRMSGGGTVVVGPGALNVAIAAPIDGRPEFAAVDVAQRWLMERLAEAITKRGPRVEVAGSGDLVFEGRKVSGSAQRRLRRSFLVHASVLYAFPLEKVSRWLREPDRRPEHRGERSHREFLANLPLERDDLADAAREAWALPDALELGPGPWGERVAGDASLRFSDPKWAHRF